MTFIITSHQMPLKTNRWLVPNSTQSSVSAISTTHWVITELLPPYAGLHVCCVCTACMQVSGRPVSWTGAHSQVYHTGETKCVLMAALRPLVNRSFKCILIVKKSQMCYRVVCACVMCVILDSYEERWGGHYLALPTTCMTKHWILSFADLAEYQT